MSKREPLLSDERARNIMKNCAYNPGTMNPVAETAAFYESLIDSGKLRVVEEVREDGMGLCAGCGTDIYIVEELAGYQPEFCPGCGAKIIRR